MKRVLIAGLYHETHTFLQGLTRCEDCEIKRGRTLIDSPGGGSPLAGAVEAAERLGWDLIPAIDLRAMPGPTVADEAVQRFWDALQRPLLENIERNLDGVFLVLHGAMVSESCDDVEGEILHRLRNALGNRRIPVCGVVDLHANFTRRMARKRRRPDRLSRESARRCKSLGRKGGTTARSTDGSRPAPDDALATSSHPLAADRYGDQRRSNAVAGSPST